MSVSPPLSTQALWQKPQHIFEPGPVPSEVVSAAGAFAQHHINRSPKRATTHQRVEKPSTSQQQIPQKHVAPIAASSLGHLASFASSGGDGRPEQEQD